MNLTRTSGALLRTSPTLEVRAHLLPNGDIAVVDWHGEKTCGCRVLTVDEALRLGEFAATLVRKDEAA